MINFCILISATLLEQLTWPCDTGAEAHVLIILSSFRGGIAIANVETIIFNLPLTYLSDKHCSRAQKERDVAQKAGILRLFWGKNESSPAGTMTEKTCISSEPFFRLLLLVTSSLDTAVLKTLQQQQHRFDTGAKGLFRV